MRDEAAKVARIGVEGIGCRTALGGEHFEKGADMALIVGPLAHGRCFG